VGIYENGKLTYSRGFGEANVEFAVQVTPETVFNGGSMAKQFTAFAVLLLVEDGKVSLDEDVRRYLPELPDYGKQYGQLVTVRQLLQHTSGLRDFDVMRQLAGAHADDVFEQDAALSLIRRQRRLNFSPGSRWSYTNSGYVLAAEIVRRVAGKALPDFLQERLFKPLNMLSTRIARSHDEYVPRRALGYRGGKTLQLWMPNASTIGDGALFTTVADLERWDSNVDRPSVGAAALERMMEPGVLTSGEKLEYGMGLFVGTLRGQRTVYNPGSYGAYLGNYLRLPSMRLGISVLCNSRTADPVSVSRRIATAVLGDRLPAAAPNAAAAGQPRSPAEVSPTALTGHYGSAADNLRVSIELAGGALVLKEGDQVVPLSADGSGTFTAGKGSEARRFRFEPAISGASPAVRELLSDKPGDEVRLLRLPYSPRVAELQQYLGSYYSDELDARYTVVMDKGGLAARWPNGNLTPLVPFRRRQFGRRGIVFTFSKTGMVIDAPRALGLRFTRVRSPTS
jgi:CubicO group peptidase (beta-lactamase class C family)